MRIKLKFFKLLVYLCIVLFFAVTNCLYFYLNILPEKPILNRSTLLRRRNTNYGDSVIIPSPELPGYDKYIVYRCVRPKAICGGLSDRQKGIVTAYIVSQILRRKFVIVMTKVCSLINFIIPHKVNWIIDEEAYKGRKSVTYYDSEVYRHKLTDMNIYDVFPADVSYFEGHIDYVDFLMKKPEFWNVTWARNLSHHDVFKTALSQLFKLAPATESKYIEFMNGIGENPLICTHLRMGKSDTLPKDGNRSDRQPDPEGIIKYLGWNLTPYTKLFVATDDDGVRTRMKTAFPAHYIDLEGDIVHLDHLRPEVINDCVGMEKVILDQFILSKCDTFVMSISGFSRVAAILRGTDEELYLALPNSWCVTKSNRLHPSQMYFVNNGLGVPTCLWEKL